MGLWQQQHASDSSVERDTALLGSNSQNEGVMTTSQAAAAGKLPRTDVTHGSLGKSPSIASPSGNCTLGDGSGAVVLGKSRMLANGKFVGMWCQQISLQTISLLSDDWKIAVSYGALDTAYPKSPCTVLAFSVCAPIVLPSLDEIDIVYNGQPEVLFEKIKSGSQQKQCKPRYVKGC